MQPCNVCDLEDQFKTKPYLTGMSAPQAAIAGAYWAFRWLRTHDGEVKFCEAHFAQFGKINEMTDSVVKTGQFGKDPAS